MTVEKLITKHIDIWSSALQTRSTAGRGSNGKIDLYGIKKLRELILELAVRGKLVPQDPNDEPASELLKRIAAEKAELVRQGKIKKQKPLPEISDDEKPFELPEGWEWVRLGFITNYGDCDKAEPIDANEDTWIVELEDIEKNTSNLLNRVKFSERPFKSSKNKFNKNDVLYGKLRPYLNKVLVADDNGVCTTEIIPIKAYGNILPSYLLLLLKSPRFIAYANESTHGMNLPRLGTEKATHAVVELTSIAEQIKIVNKVDELISLCDQLEQQSRTSLDAHQQLVDTLLATLTNSQNAKELSENWARISQHFDTLFTTEASIDALKQTILQLAVMGKLVPQDPNDEPASELLKRIEQEKALMVKSGKIKKQKLLPPISDKEKPFELPQGWKWVRLIDIMTDIHYGYTASANETTEIKLLRITDIQDNKVNWETVPGCDINEKMADQYKLVNGDIVIARTGGTVGKSYLVENINTPAVFASYLIRLKYHRPMQASFTKIFLGSQLYWRQLYDGTSGTGQPNVNGNTLKAIVLPIPPLNEQNRIVSKVNELFSICDTLKSRLQSAQQTQLHLADALTDAALN